MNAQTTQSFAVTGMSCDHCADAVSGGLTVLEGVSDVRVQLVTGGMSTVTVTSDRPLAESEVSSALDEAGDYRLA